MRVGPHGLLQPIADAVKLLTKEDTIPASSDRGIFWFAPVLSTFTALTAFSVIPFTPWIRIADVNVGLLIISATSSIGIIGIVLGGWSSNSHYSLLGSLRSGAQLISYEVALAFSLLCGVMAAGTLSMTGIVNAQMERRTWFVFENFGLMAIPFFTYLIAAVAETNRAPFDLPEAESELVAGFHTEYSGFRWALYFLAEYANIFVISSVAVTLFWGGWLRPFPNVPWLAVPLNYGFPVLLLVGSGAMCFLLARRLPSKIQAIGLMGVGLVLIGLGLLFLIPLVNNAVIALFWFVFKVAIIVYCMIWFRGTWPRLRYDQLMNIGWKRLIPIGMCAVMVNALVGMLRQ
jgi:NADH-quinone oxidoreductase subunit H